MVSGSTEVDSAELSEILISICSQTSTITFVASGIPSLESFNPVSLAVV